MSDRKNIVASAEQLFVWFAARIEPSDHELNHAQNILKTVTNWEAMLKHAAIHGVSALLYHNNNKHRQMGYPKEVLAALKKQYLRNLMQHERNKMLLAQLLPALNAKGIEPVIFKGMAWAMEHYPDAALRPMADIDMMVGMADIHTAEAIMLDLGARSEHPDGEQALRKGLTNQITPMTFDSLQATIDLHWEVMPEVLGFDITWAKMQAASIAKQLGDANYRVLEASDELLFGHVHNRKNVVGGGQRIMTLNDLRLLKHKTPKLEIYNKKTRDCYQKQADFVDNYFVGINGKNLHKQDLFKLSLDSEIKLNVNQHFAKVLFAENTVWGFAKQTLMFAFPSLDYMQKNYKAPNKFVAALYYPVRHVKGLYYASLEVLQRRNEGRIK